MIKKLKNPQSKVYRGFKDIIFNMGFDWYYLNSVNENQKDFDSEKNNDFGFYVHPLIARPKPGEFYHSKEVSKHVDHAEILVHEILKANSLKAELFYRMSLNCTHPTGIDMYSPPHVDHCFPHHNMLIYLSDTYGGDTLVGDEKHIGMEDDIIIFPGDVEHCHKPPLKGRRIVLVTTMLLKED
tara:strand:- start:654 stop:1202 length:549 start_codon:yes stop_codon:yes gene_type:complete